MNAFSAKILKLGINPCVNVPGNVLSKLFRQAGKNKGPIPVHGTLNGKEFKQTVVKYRGAWRLYLNTQMRRDAGIDVGDDANVKIEFDPEQRAIPIHPKLTHAFRKNKKAKAAFAKLSPSRQKEILRYLCSLKREESITRNIHRVIGHLLST